jgi:valyl-tRNA synthetase
LILEFNGVFRFAARKLIVHQLEAQGLMEKNEPHVHTVPHGDRSNAVIEPRLTDQWYVDAATLAKPGDRRGETRAHRGRAEELGEHLFPLDGKHPTLVHLAPAMVGPPDPRLVRP